MGWRYYYCASYNFCITGWISIKQKNLRIASVGEHVEALNCNFKW